MADNEIGEQPTVDPSPAPEAQAGENNKAESFLAWGNGSAPSLPSIDSQPEHVR